MGCNYNLFIQLSTGIQYGSWVGLLLYVVGLVEGLWFLLHHLFAPPALMEQLQVGLPRGVLGAYQQMRAGNAGLLNFMAGTLPVDNLELVLVLLVLNHHGRILWRAEASEGIGSIAIQVVFQELIEYLPFHIFPNLLDLFILELILHRVLIEALGGVDLVLQVLLHQLDTANKRRDC